MPARLPVAELEVGKSVDRIGSGGASRLWHWLKRFYERDPRRFAISQLSFLLGVIVVYLWVIPVWYWAVYRGGLPVSQGVSDFLYWVWLNEQVFAGY